MSKATVSNALSGKRYVAAVTIDRVRNMCDELGYKPNWVASSLRTQKTGVIGVIVPNITEPYVATMVVALENELKTNGYHMLLGNYDFDSREEDRIIQRLLNFMIDGVIVVSGLDHNTPRYSDIAADIPVIFIDKESTSAEVVCVQIDHRKAAVDAVRYLVSKGHRKIVHLTIPYDDFSVLRMRVEGFKKGLEEDHIRFDDSMLLVERGVRLNEITTSMELAEKIVGTGVTAVFVVSDYVAVGLSKGLTSLGVRIPEDISILGTTNIDYCKVTTPTLSSIDFAPSECARTAVAVIDEMVNVGIAPKGDYGVAHRIVERESVFKIPD